MSNKALTLVLKTIVFIIFYSIHFFVLSTISAIYDIPTTLMTYILPILIILFLSFITQKTYSISCQLYAYIYYISTAYLGLILNMYMFILLYKSLSFFIPFTRCSSVIIAIISPISVSLYGLINARIITTEEVTIKTALVSSKVTIALLSDLHLGAVYQGGFTNSIVNIIIKEINPDVVLITGDLFDNNFTPRSEWLKPFSKIKAPILYVTGNHEEIIGKEEIVKIISTTKMKHLRNTNISFETIKEVNFIGVDYGVDINTNTIIANKVDKTKFNILLSHIPQCKPNGLEKYGISLMVCGHTHAGQMIPIHLIDYMISKCFKGLYSFKEYYVFVTQGLGTSLFPMRVASNSAIGVIKLEN